MEYEIELKGICAGTPCPLFMPGDITQMFTANGTAHNLLPSKYIGQPLIDRLPHLKRVRRSKKTYIYFIRSVDGERRQLSSELPPIGNSGFALEYQKELMKRFGEATPLYRKTAKRVVYFIGAENGPIKIGLATNVRKRLEAIQTGSPVILTILATVEGSFQKENEYHKKFAESRLHGEWFEPHPDILVEIKRLNEATS